MDTFTFSQAMEELIEPAGLGDLVVAWKRKRRDSRLVAFVTGFEHKLLPRLRPSDVDHVLEHSTHALGWLTKERDTDGFIARANPPWAMAYLFHACMEYHLGRIPTWGEYFAYVTGPAAKFWWEPVRRSARRRGLESLQSYRAATWRLGTAWQSAIRTVATIAALRHLYGVPVRYHLFTHVELRIDGWSGNQAFRLVMPSEYEASKTDPRLIFAERGVQIHDLVVTRQQRGRVWMPPERSVKELARQLQVREGVPQLALFGSQSATFGSIMNPR